VTYTKTWTDLVVKELIIDKRKLKANINGIDLPVECKLDWKIKSSVDLKQSLFKGKFNIDKR